MVSMEPCGVALDCRGGLAEYLGSALGDSDLGSEVAAAALAAARTLQAPYGPRVVGGIRIALELRGLTYSEELGSGILDSIGRWKFFQDAAGGIERLRSAGYRVALISDMEENVLRGLLGNSGIEVDYVYGARVNSAYRPNPRAIFNAYRDSGTPIWRGLHAGPDVDDDVRPAMVLGLRTAWVNRYGEEEPEEGIASEYVVESLGELAEQLAEGDEGRSLDGWLEGEGGAEGARDRDPAMQ